MKFTRVRSMLPDWKSVLAALASAVLLIGAFPDFEFWFLAWFALVPLLWTVEREKDSVTRSFILGWVFGTVFFFGTCWWLTFAPITYAGFPPALAYFLMFGVTALVGIFPGIFAALLAILLKRFGSIARIAAPFVWVFTEFLRYWLTGNNWNAFGYSQAFAGLWGNVALDLSSFGGVLLSSGYTVAINCVLAVPFSILYDNFLDKRNKKGLVTSIRLIPPLIGTFGILLVIPVLTGIVLLALWGEPTTMHRRELSSVLIAIQPDVPMTNLDYKRWEQLRQHQIDIAEKEVLRLKPLSDVDFRRDQRVPFEPPEVVHLRPIFVVLPESPMNFMYNDDREFQKFINDFARRNDVSVLFNSAEPDKTNGKYFNSAVMVDPEGREVGEYDKIYLLPFGEAVPSMLEGLVPGFVGNFSYGSEYDLFPLGDAKAGVMICFESHFGQLSREYVRNGADVLIEMTNDGYLGPTPVLRQHLANAVFRAVETHRPVLRVTNVGITAYITEKGEVLDPTAAYQEDTRVWSVSKSDGSQTFYVKYGDWFAWLCSIVTVGLLGYAIFRRRQQTV